jgi:DNA (cytosine-5)-methyltransferase 1
MRTPQFILGLADELVVDLFAGGGGASCGIEQAIGRHVDIAVNHDRLAVAQHFANHPQTQHYCEDVFDVSPQAVTEGRPVGLLWASPDCKHFSKAKGGKPVSKKIRGLAWVRRQKASGEPQ